MFLFFHLVDSQMITSDNREIAICHLVLMIERSKKEEQLKAKVVHEANKSGYLYGSGYIVGGVHVENKDVKIVHKKVN